MPSIGDYELHVIHAGNFALDGGAMFGIVPKALWSRRITPDSNNRIPLSMRCLLLVGNGRVVLIDNGHGDKYDVKFAQIYGIDDDELNVEASLNAAGFSRADVTDVILTRISTSTMPAATRLSQEIGMCPPSPMPRTTCRNATWHGRAHQTRGRKPPSFRRTSSRS